MISHQTHILLFIVITPNTGVTKGKGKKKHISMWRHFTITADPQILGFIKTTQLIYLVLLSVNLFNNTTWLTYSLIFHLQRFMKSYSKNTCVEKKKKHNPIHHGLMFAHRQFSSAELMALCQVRVVSSHHRTILPLGI